MTGALCWDASHDPNILYQFSDVQRTFQESTTYCQGIGGQIAKINTKRIRDHISVEYPYYFWIDAQPTSVSSGEFAWLDDKHRAINIPFAAGYAYIFLNKNCDALVKYFDGGWIGQSCGTTQSVLCEKKLKDSAEMKEEANDNWNNLIRRLDISTAVSNLVSDINASATNPSFVFITNVLFYLYLAIVVLVIIIAVRIFQQHVAKRPMIKCCNAQDPLKPTVEPEHSYYEI